MVFVVEKERACVFPVYFMELFVRQYSLLVKFHNRNRMDQQNVGGVYHSREPRASPLWHLLNENFD